MSYIKKYYDGDNVIVLADPDDAHTFSSWSGDVPLGHETDNPLSLVMDQDRHIIGTFDWLIQIYIGLHGKKVVNTGSNAFSTPRNQEVEIAVPFDLTITSLWAGTTGNFGIAPMGVRYKVNGTSRDDLLIIFSGTEGAITKNVSGALQIPQGQTVCYEILGPPLVSAPVWLSTAYAEGLVSIGTLPVGGWAIRTTG